MTAMTSLNFINSFEKNCDDIVQNCEPVIITRNNGNNVVVVSQAEYSSLIKTLYTCQGKIIHAKMPKPIKESKFEKSESNSEYLKMLDESRAQFERGETITFSMEELEAMESDNWVPTQKVLDFMREHILNKTKN